MMFGLLPECGEGQDVHSGYAAAHFLDGWGEGGLSASPEDCSAAPTPVTAALPPANSYFVPCTNLSQTPFQPESQEKLFMPCGISPHHGLCYFMEPFTVCH